MAISSFGVSLKDSGQWLLSNRTVHSPLAWTLCAGQRGSCSWISRRQQGSRNRQSTLAPRGRTGVDRCVSRALNFEDLEVFILEQRFYTNYIYWSFNSWFIDPNFQMTAYHSWGTHVSEVMKNIHAFGQALLSSPRALSTSEGGQRKRGASLTGYPRSKRKPNDPVWGSQLRSRGDS